MAEPAILLSFSWASFRVRGLLRGPLRGLLCVLLRVLLALKLPIFSSESSNEGVPPGGIPCHGA